MTLSWRNVDRFELEKTLVGRRGSDEKALVAELKFYLIVFDLEWWTSRGLEVLVQPVRFNETETEIDTGAEIGGELCCKLFV